jgi:DNA-binding response OmpR family regulator
VQQTSPCILAVDDDPDIGIMLKVMLEYKGYQVVVFDRAEQLEDAFQSHSIQLIIMDMLLSGANGMDICRSLQSGKTSSNIPILMTSAHPNAKELCMQSGADDFIAKPFEMYDLLHKIEKLILPQ